MNLLDTLSRLSASEVNVGMQTDWDGKMRVWVGYLAREVLAEKWFSLEEFDGIAGWLDAKVREMMPASQYAAETKVSP